MFIKKYLLLLALPLLFFCENSKVKQTDILVSIPPQKYFIDRISGNSLTVHVVNPQNKNPYTHSLNTKMADKIKKSYIYFMIGNVSFEQKQLNFIKKTNPSIKIIDLASTIKSQGQPSKNIPKKDEFIWLSPGSVKEIAGLVANKLSGKFPRFKDIYAENLEMFIKEIDDFDYSAKAIFRDTIKKDFLTTRKTFSYFTKHYKLKPIQIKEHIKDNDVISKKFIKSLKKKKIKSFVTTVYSKETLPGTVAAKIKSATFTIDPFDYDWLDNMHMIVSTFKDALNHQ